MPFLLLLLLTLVLLPDRWSRPLWLLPENAADLPARPHDLIASAALTWLVVALVVAFARYIAARVAHGLEQYPGHRERLLRDYGRLRTYHVFLLLGAYAVVVYVLGWGWTVRSLCLYGGEMLPGAEAFILAPFLAALVLSWVVFYDAERALHDSAEMSEAEVERARGLAAVGFKDEARPELVPPPAEPFWSRGAYVGFHVRQNLALICAPLLLILLMKGLHRLFPETEEGPSGWAITLGGALLSLTVIVGMPWLLRLALGLKPMPPGPLRSRLEATARRLHFRCNNILVWNTRGGVANAMVAGVVPWVRYVILTDRLMSELTPDEVEAVFGHEVGHARHHHMLLYLGFLAVSVALVGALWSWLAWLIFQDHSDKLDTTLASVPLVTMLGAYIFVVFGFLSRRCERQADVFGCRAVSCERPDCTGHEGLPGAAEAPPAPPAPRLWRVLDLFVCPMRPLRGTNLCPTGIRTFIDALEKVARLNGISRDRPGWLSSWQHSTIARRVQFLQDVLADRALEQRFQRRVALVKVGLFVGLVAALGALWYALGPDDGMAGEAKPAHHYQPGGESATPHTGARTAPWE
jgi:Zn-dependent protease with chaperone function